MSQIKLKPDSGLGAAAPATDAQLAALRAGFGLGNVDNTADVDKPISAAVQEALDALPIGGAVDTPFPTDFAIRYDRNYRKVSAVYTQAGPITFTRNETGAIDDGEMEFAILSDGSAIDMSALRSSGAQVLGDNLASPEAGATYSITAFHKYGRFSTGALKIGQNLVAPGAPTIGTATASDGAASVTFTAPASNGGAAITGYTVTSTPGGLTGTGSASPIVVSGLMNGTPYTFRAKATNIVDTGSESAASNSVTPASATLGKLVIVEDDYQLDPDGIGGMATAFMAHQLGYWKILGVIVNSSGPKVPGSIDALRKWYGIPTSFPMGVWKGVAKDPTDSAWVADGYDCYSHDVGLASTVADSTVQYRTLLAAAADNSVEIVANGYANALDALLSSPADGISGLTGAQLISAKVKMLWWSAGEFPTATTAEVNMQGGNTLDATFCAMSDRVVKNWPSPITFAGFLFGQTPAVNGARLTSSKTLADPRRRAFQSYNGGVDNGGWGEQLTIAAMDQAGLTFVKGTNTGVSTSTGVNTWVDNPSGKDRYMVKTQSSTWYKDRIEALSCLDPSSTLPVPNWGTSAAIVPAIPWTPVLPPLDAVTSGEKVTNSTFNNNDLSGWTGVNASLGAVNGSMAVLGTAGYAIAYATFATNIGQSYTVTAKLDFMEAAGSPGEDVKILAKAGTYTDSENAPASGSNTRNTPGLYSFTFVAISTTTTIMTLQDGGNTRNYAFDRISVA